jgi:AhpD family alkylhydroperoxidase
MTPRIDVMKYVGSGPGRAILALQREVEKSGLDKSLLHLVEIRASQINGCAYCIDMHTKDARAAGEAEQRIYALNAWRETPFFTDRERAALDWAEQVTLVADSHIPDDAFERVRQQFNESEVVALTVAAATINVWNRLSIAFRAPAGTYQPHAVTA